MMEESKVTRKVALQAMRFSESPEIVSFLAKYDKIPERDRVSLSIEAVAIAAEVNVAHLLGEIMLAVRDHSANRVKLIAIASHPDVMKMSVECALLPDGLGDRKDIHTMLGALPSNKGTTFINKFFAGGTKDSDESGEPEELVDDLDYVFPDSSIMQEKVQPLRQKLLESRK